MRSNSRNVIDLKKAAAQRAKEREAPRMSHGNRPARLRTRRRNKRIMMFCVCLLAGAGLVGTLGAASHLQQFAITDVSVAGTQQLAPESLTNAVKASLEPSGFQLFSRKNMFLYPKSTIESKLSQEFPRIKDVTVARASLLAQAVVVSVEERTPYATWCPGKGDERPLETPAHCYAMDSHGFIYAEAADAEKSYVFSGGLLPETDIVGQTFLRGRLPGIVALLDSLVSAGYTAEGMTVDSEKDFTISLRDGPRLHASFDMPPADIIRNLTTALEAEGLKEKFESLEYIDLRFGNRVYYK